MAATHTEHLNLIKQDFNDDVSVFDLNDNMDTIDAAVVNMNLMITVPSIVALPYTITNSKITANHQIVMSVLSNPVAMQGDEWTYTTAEGSVTISGTIIAPTDITMYLMKVY